MWQIRWHCLYDRDITTLWFYYYYGSYICLRLWWDASKLVETNIHYPTKSKENHFPLKAPVSVKAWSVGHLCKQGYINQKASILQCSCSRIFLFPSTRHHHKYCIWLIGSSPILRPCLISVTKFSLVISNIWILIRSIKYNIIIKLIM
jgi:hypothetical protein